MSARKLLVPQEQAQPQPFAVAHVEGEHWSREHFWILPSCDSDYQPGLDLG